MSLREDLKAYLDGELSPSRVDEVRIALEKDPALYKEYAELKSISDGLAQYASQPTAKGLESTLQALGRSKRRPWLNPRLIWIPAGAVAAGCAAVFFFGVFAHSASYAKRSFFADSASAGPSETVDSEAKMMASNKPAAPLADARKAANGEFFLKKTPTSNGVVADGTTSTREKATLAAPASPRPHPRERLVAAKSKPFSPKKDAAPQTVVLAFASPEIGAKRVLDLVGRYRVAADASKQTVLSSQVPPISEGPETIVVEVPEYAADATLKRLKILPTQAPVAFRAAAPGGFGVAGGAMGGAGRSNGSFGAPSGARAGGGGGYGGGGIGGGFRASGEPTRAADSRPLPNSVTSTSNSATLKARTSTTKSVNADRLPNKAKFQDTVNSPAGTVTTNRAVSTGRAPQKMRRIVIRIVKKH